MNDIMLTLLRTTVCTVLAGGVASLLLGQQGVTSPTAHRVAHALVLLQGWAFVPLIVELPVQTAVPAELRSDTVFDDNMAVANASFSDWQKKVVMNLEGSADVARANWVAVFWIGGAGIVAIFYLTQYVLLVHKLPLGCAPTKPEWKSEWDNVSRDFCVTNTTQFRITDKMGPLVCFVPFFYLVLTPSCLWSALDRAQRESVLRHELAHIRRLDLWKSVAIRILALPQWFNPLAWRAVRAFDEAAEWACDDLVMNDSEQRHDMSYATALIRIAESTLEPLRGSVAARGGVLSTRIRRLVEPRFKEETKMTNVFVPMLLAGIVLAQLVRIETVAAETAAGLNENTNAAEERTADLARTGLLPYRVAPPDIIRVEVASAEVNGLSRQQQSPPYTGNFLIGADGNITLKGIPAINVAGMTVEEIEGAIKERLPKDSKQTKLAVEVLAKNSKCFYVVYEDSTDHVYRIPCTQDSDVHGALTTLTWPHPVDFGKCDIRLLRPLANNLDTVLPIDWTKTNGGKAKDNHKLLPGDRLFVTTANHVPPQPQYRPDGQAPPTPLPLVGACEFEEVTMQTPAGPKAIKLGIPVACRTGETEEFTFDTPEGRATVRLPAIRSLPPEKLAKPADESEQRDVKVQIELLRDKNGNLAEFEDLKSGLVMQGDAKQTLATLRILAKNKLVERLSTPIIACKSGQQATVMIDESRFRVTIEVTPSVLDDSTFVLATRIKLQTENKTKELAIDTSAAVGTGKTVIMPAHSDDRIYVALTPKLLR